MLKMDVNEQESVGRGLDIPVIVCWTLFYEWKMGDAVSEMLFFLGLKIEGHVLAASMRLLVGSGHGSRKYFHFDVI